MTRLMVVLTFCIVCAVEQWNKLNVTRVSGALSSDCSEDSCHLSYGYIHKQTRTSTLHMQMRMCILIVSYL